MKTYLLIVFTAIGFSCKPDKPVRAKPGACTIDKPVTAPHKVEGCDTDFDVFFEKFSLDSVFQKEHIKFPLKRSHLDNDYQDFVSEDVTESEYHFMDFASHKNGMKQEYDKYTVEITEGKDTVAYFMKGYDNSIMINITFSFFDGCWYLVEIEDAST
jgi:hypothetical protein